MKNVFLLLILLLSVQLVSAQSKLGLKLSPTLSLNRATYDNDTYDLQEDGTGGRFVFGLIYDYMLSENYYLSTGLLYAPKRLAFSLRDKATATEVKEAYNLQYLQLPATLKLFTNELSLDTRVYFQLGGLLELKVAEKAQGKDYDVVDDIRFFDTSLYVGAGLERRLGYNTLLFGGIFYNRGLLNAVTDLQAPYDFELRNDLLGLDLGIKF
jgi:hypothetical protein